MNGLWNLDPIYRGFDDPAFEGDLEKLKQKVAKDLYKAGVLGPDAVGFANDDLWRSALKDAFHSYFPGSEDVWESLKK